MSSLRVSVLLIGVLSSLGAFSAEMNKAQSLGVAQGISSPSVTSTVNFSKGFTSENPVGVLYSQGIRLTGEYDQNGNKGYGGELGYGNSSWGAAVGYSQRDCDDCEGDVAGAAAVSVAGAGLGIRVAEDIYGLGAVINYAGNIRVGLMAELTDGDTDVRSYGMGMAYFASQWTFAVDVSKEDSDSSSDNDLILVTPGLILHSDLFQVSVNYQARVNGDSSSDGDFWMGVGIDIGLAHIAVYSDYVNDISAALTILF